MWGTGVSPGVLAPSWFLMWEKDTSVTFHASGTVTCMDLLTSKRLGGWPVSILQTPASACCGLLVCGFALMKGELCLLLSTCQVSWLESPLPSSHSLPGHFFKKTFLRTLLLNNSCFLIIKLYCPLKEPQTLAFRDISAKQCLGSFGITLDPLVSPGGWSNEALWDSSQTWTQRPVFFSFQCVLFPLTCFSTD